MHQLRGLVGVFGAVVVATGCGNPSPQAGPIPVYSGPVVLAPVTRAKPALQQLGVIANPPRISAAVTGVAPVSSPVIDARLLVLSADGKEPELEALKEVLGYLGTPFTVYRATVDTGFGPSFLSDGASHGYFQGIILTTGLLAYSTATDVWVSAFSQQQWDTLAAYEAAFHVRRAALYAQPNTDLGMGFFTPVDTSSAPLSLSCTAAGRNVFLSINCDAPIIIDQAWAYLAAPAGASTTALLVDSAGHAPAVVHTFADGREMLALTFAHNMYLPHTLQLAFDLVAWAAGGLYLGARHVYVGAQIDDIFIADDIYGSSKEYRMDSADLNAVLAWQKEVQAQPASEDFRLHMVFNGSGASSGDGLTKAAQANSTAWYWINHTYNHENLDSISYANALSELGQNITTANTYKLQPFGGLNLVTPDVSGLANQRAMQAAYDVGIRYTVSDTSVAGYNNPSPNTGIVNSLVPGIFMIPRRPVNLFYNVSQPSEWVAEYNSMYRKYFGRDLSYAEIIDYQSDELLRYMLKGEIDPWMFHQPNLRAYDGTHTLLGDLIDELLRKYRARASLPVLSPSEDKLGGKMQARMAWNAAKVTASIKPGISITISSDKAVTLPVSGLDVDGAELYGGRHIAQVEVPANGSVTLPLPGAGGSDGGVDGSADGSVDGSVDGGIDGGSGGSGGTIAGSGGTLAGSGGALAGSGGTILVGSGGTIEGSGGTIVGSGGTIEGSGGTIVGSGGTIEGSGGTIVGSGGTIVGSGGTIEGSGGTIAGSGGTVAGSGGTVAGSGGTVAGSGGTIAGGGGSLGSGGATGEGGTSGEGGASGEGGSTAPDAGTQQTALNAFGCSVGGGSPGATVLGLLPAAWLLRRRRGR